MPDRITAVEIIRQSEQGVSVRPFLVRANDGNRYFVKGLSRAGGPSLMSEVIAAELGGCLGLPIPEWRIMDIPPALIDFSPIENVQDLAGGPAFASLQVDNASELMWSGVRNIPVELQRKVLVFDWWILNGDRGLGENGGNVNLLLDAQGNLVVIDHNAAFDSTSTAEQFRTYHVFRDQLGHFQDYVTRQEYVRELDAALAHWDRISALLPVEWIYRDQDEIDETIPTLLQRLETLQQFREERFWGQL
ncbi:HipA family kinase [Stutzerimonas nitrititolerans]|uniref:HipA family kinase n=1 Tax=Stutzerimonas nitrititolerans TaxID=2482751 RepID=UPI0028A738FC|nr:HipA family kinase [Stutzerimonas nitrititolerans]